jgi:hypothetical protein
MSLDVALTLVFIALSGAAVAAMASRRIFLVSPVFFAYLCFEFVAAIAGLAVYDYTGLSLWYWCFFLVWLAGNCLLCFCSLAEIGNNLRCSNGKSRPRWSLAFLLFAAASVLVLGLARWTDAPGRSPLSNLCFVGMRANGALEFAGFLALVFWSNLRKLHWPERELHIGTGFGFLTFASFLLSILLFQWNTGPVYYGLYEGGQAANLFVLAYWLRYFWIVDPGLPARRRIPEEQSRNSQNDREPTQ